MIAEGDMDKVQNDPASSKSIWEPSVLTIKTLNQFYGGSHTLWDVDLDVPCRRADVPDGPQRHG